MLGKAQDTCIICESKFQKCCYQQGNIYVRDVLLFKIDLCTRKCLLGYQ